MIVADSCVWIDYLNGTATLQSEMLDALLGDPRLLLGDLILTETLQGFDRPRDFERVRAVMTKFDIIDIAGLDVAVQAAANRRYLRAMGISIRSTIDALIATRCIRDGYRLLTSDHDFAPFFTHLGLLDATD